MGRDCCRFEISRCGGFARTRSRPPQVNSTILPQIFIVLVDWLKVVGIATSAMESYGVYWIPVFESLESRSFDVILVNAREAKRVPWRKTEPRRRTRRRPRPPGAFKTLICIRPPVLSPICALGSSPSLFALFPHAVTCVAGNSPSILAGKFRNIN